MFMWTHTFQIQELKKIQNDCLLHHKSLLFVDEFEIVFQASKWSFGKNTFYSKIFKNLK